MNPIEAMTPPVITDDLFVCCLQKLKIGSLPDQMAYMVFGLKISNLCMEEFSLINHLLILAYWRDGPL